MSASELEAEIESVCSQTPAGWVIGKIESLQLQLGRVDSLWVSVPWQMQVWRWVYGRRPVTYRDIKDALLQLAARKAEFPTGLTPVNPDPSATADLLLRHWGEELDICIEREGSAA